MFEHISGISNVAIVDGPKPEMVATVQHVAAVLGLTPMRIRQLADEGIVPKAGRNQYPLDRAVQGYVKWRLETIAGKNADSSPENRVRDARTREIELRIAERENRLIDIDEHNAVVDELVGLFLAGLESLPARATRDITQRRQIEASCDGLRREIADRAAKRGRELRQGGAAAVTDAEDDA